MTLTPISNVVLKTKSLEQSTSATQSEEIRAPQGTGVCDDCDWCLGMGDRDLAEIPEISQLGH